jgi:hypothetical protein
MHNPFTIGSMIQNPAEFVGRTAELANYCRKCRSQAAPFFTQAVHASRLTFFKPEVESMTTTF